MGFKNRHNNKVEQKDRAKVHVSAETETETEIAKPIVPACIAELKALSTNVANVEQIPANMLVQRTKIVQSLYKLADRIHNGLGAATKKAEREAARVKRAKARIKRDATKKTKKLDAIKVLKEKLAKMEAEVAPTDEK